MKPIIGITPGYRKKADEAAFRYDLPVTYAGAISRAGGLPVMLAGAPGDAGEWARALDGLLLPGGGDIAPALYGAANLYSNNISEQRDAVEIAAARAVWEARKPVLGICRGIQVLCVALGGTLVQDIGRELALSHPYLPTPCHGITIRPGSILSSIVGVPGVVNSTHHQALRDIPASLVPVAWS